MTRREADAVPAELRNLGQALTLLRVWSRANQGELARRAGLGKSQLSKYEAGREVPKIPTLCRLAAALGANLFGVFYLTQLLDEIEARRGAAAAALGELQAAPRLGGVATEIEEEFAELMRGNVRLLMRAQAQIVASEQRRRAIESAEGRLAVPRRRKRPGAEKG